MLDFLYHDGTGHDITRSTVMNLYDLLNPHSHLLYDLLNPHSHTTSLLLQRPLSHSASRVCHNAFSEVQSLSHCWDSDPGQWVTHVFLADEGHKLPWRCTVLTLVPCFVCTEEFSAFERCVEAPLFKYPDCSHWGTQTAFRHSLAPYTVDENSRQIIKGDDSMNLEWKKKLKGWK